MTIKYAAWVLLAAILATVAAIFLSAINPQRADAGKATVNTCSGGTIELSNAEQRTLKLHNHARRARGLKALCVRPDLTSAARAHAREMLDKDYASHYSFNGESVGDRLIRFGYTSAGYSYYLYGENIAWGCGSYGSPDYIFDLWMHSPEHRSNILNKRYREVGIGVRTGTFRTCTRATTYTVDFGTRRH